MVDESPDGTEVGDSAGVSLGVVFSCFIKKYDFEDCKNIKNY